MKLGFQPLHDRVLIHRRPPETMVGSIVIPDTSDIRPSIGTVVGLGFGTIMRDGSVRPLSVKEGDVVCYERYAGFEIELDVAEVNGKKLNSSS